MAEHATLFVPLSELSGVRIHAVGHSKEISVKPINRPSGIYRQRPLVHKLIQQHKAAYQSLPKVEEDLLREPPGRV